MGGRSPRRRYLARAVGETEWSGLCTESEGAAAQSAAASPAGTWLGVIGEVSALESSDPKHSSSSLLDSRSASLPIRPIISASHI